VPRRLLLLEHLSLDGFLAGPNGEMDWIHVDEDLFAASLPIYANADAALYGRTTYDMMANYWPTAGDAPDASEHDKGHSSWLNRSTVYVASNTLREAPWGTSGSAIVVKPDAIADLKQTDGGDIVLIGSVSLARACVAANLIDEMWLFVNPVVLGGGMPLFSSRDQRLSLQLRDVQTFAGGVACLHYAAA
jgi:dihydrofolate reductase